MAMSPGVEGPQHSPTVSPGAINPVTPLSVRDFLYSLARTPTPTRFDRRRQRLEGKPRLSRVRRYVQDAGCSTSVGAGFPQHEQAPKDEMISAQPPLDSEDCQQPSYNEPDSLTREQTIRIARLALPNPATDVSSGGEATKGTGGKVIDADHLLKQISITPIESPPPYGKHRYQYSAGDSSMFASTHSIDEDEESDNIERASLHQGHGTKISLESPVSSDFKGLRGPSSDPEDDVTPGERGCIETSILGQVEHISVQAQQNFLPSPKMKLRRPASRQQTERKTYGHRKPLEYQQHATKTRMPRRLPVNELELALDPVPSNPIYDSDAEATEFDNDPIQDFSSSPFKGSIAAARRRNAAKVAKKRKSLNELQQNILKPKAIDLFKYKLPNTYEMSPSTKKRLKMSMTCSDGFEGRENRPIGRTMPMRLPRRHPQVFRQTFTRMTELTLTSFRDLTKNIEIPQRLQGEPVQSNAITVFYHEEIEIVKGPFDPLKHSRPLEDRNKIHRPGGNPRLESLTMLLPPSKGNCIHTEEIAAVTVPPSSCRLKRRVTFSEDVAVLQTLRMVSAPIVIPSPCESDDSEEGITDDDDDDDGDDRTSSGSSDEDRSDGDPGGGSDDQYGSEEGNSDGEIDAEGKEALQHSTASVKATLQSLQYSGRSPEESKQARASNSQRLALNDEFVRQESVYDGGINQNNCSPDLLLTQSIIERGEILITEESRQEWNIAEDNSWRPRRLVSTHRLIEVDDDILDYPNSTTELSRGDDERGPFRSASGRKLEIQSCDDGHACSNRAGSEHVEDMQRRELSQTSVELGNPKWSVLHHHGDEQPHSQAQNPDYLPEGASRYVVQDYATYMARALDSFSNPSQGSFSLARSKSMPSRHRFHCVDEQIQEDLPAKNLGISPAFKHTVSPLKRSLSQMQSTDLRALTRRMSPGTTPVRGRIQPLSFKPPFLRD